MLLRRIFQINKSINLFNFNLLPRNLSNIKHDLLFGDHQPTQKFPLAKSPNNFFHKTNNDNGLLCNAIPKPPAMGPLSLEQFGVNAGADMKLKYFQTRISSVFNLPGGETELFLKSKIRLLKTWLPASLEYLITLGVNAVTIRKHFWLLSMPSDEIYSKLCKIEEFFPEKADINLHASLLQLSEAHLEELLQDGITDCKDSGFPSKFHYLSKTLKVPINDVLDNLEPFTFLISIPFQRVRLLTEMFLRAGMSESDLATDFKIFQYTPATLQRRLKVLAEANIPVKPWLLRKKKENFDNLIQCELSHECTVEGILERLQCDPDTAKWLRERRPLRNSGIHIRIRIKQLLDFLIDEKGLEPSLFNSNPDVIQCSVKLARERVALFEANGIDLRKNVRVLAKAVTPFNRFMRNYQKNKKREEEEEESQ